MLPKLYKNHSSIPNQPKLIRLVSVLITNIIQSVNHQPQFFFQPSPGILDNDNRSVCIPLISQFIFPDSAQNRPPSKLDRCSMVRLNGNLFYHPRSTHSQRKSVSFLSDKREQVLKKSSPPHPEKGNYVLPVL